jgi:hypothetical protein
MKESKESPIASFRVPLDVIAKLIDKGVLKEDYNKSDLSRVAREELFRSIDADIQAPINVDDVYGKVDNVDSKLDEVLSLLGKLTVQ